MNRQRLLVTVFLALFFCSLLYSYIRMPRQKTVDKLKFVPGMSAPVAAPLPGQDADTARLRLDLLEARPGRSSTGGKNIFYGVNLAPAKKPLPLPLPPPPPPVPQPQPLPPAAAKPSAPAVAEPTVLQREMATFTFLGFLKKENRKTIFLSNGKEIFLVKKGDKIAGKYDVTSLTDEALTISSLLDGGEILIPLVENKPLHAPRK